MQLFDQLVVGQLSDLSLLFLAPRLQSRLHCFLVPRLQSLLHCFLAPQLQRTLPGRLHFPGSTASQLCSGLSSSFPSSSSFSSSSSLPLTSDILGWPRVSFRAPVPLAPFIPQSVSSNNFSSSGSHCLFPSPPSLLLYGFLHLDHIFPGCPSSLLISNWNSFCWLNYLEWASLSCWSLMR